MLAADGGGGGAVSVGAGMDSLGKQMSDFKNAANAGQFSVNDEGGKALLAALQEMHMWVREQNRNVNFQERDGEYGGSHGAGVIEPYMNQVATDQDGFIQAMSKFQDVLVDAESAIKQAMDNYQQTDSGNATNVRNV